MSAAGQARRHRLARRRSPPAARDETGLTWRTLLQYARAAKDFTATPSVSLPATSFDKLTAADRSCLPPAEMFELADAGQMAFRRYGPAGEGAALVLLIHGSGGHAGQLHGLARAIAGQGLGEVYALDLRGHGSSPGRRGHAVRHHDQLCADVCEFLHFMHRSRPAAPVVIGGHSAGGGLALRVLRSPAGRRLSGCFFLAPYLGLGSATIRPLFGGWVGVRAKRLRALALANVLGIRWFNGSTTVAFNLGPLGHDPAYAPSWSFNTMLAFGPGLWSATSPPVDPRIPVLSICGDRDECFFGDAYPDAFRILAPHAELASVECCGHWDILVDPGALTIVTGWLRRVLGDRAGPAARTARADH